MQFWLGTHMPSWLSRTDVAVPLFVSHVRLRNRKTLPAAVAPWALDSGGFSEVAARGADAFSEGPAPYITAVRRYHDEIGQLAWAAPQDWMCEPFMTAKTGLSVAEHQRRTVRNLLDLRMAAPDLPFIPVLQGWTPDDYLRSIDLYTAAGVDLSAEPLVGLGSVCRRNRTGEIVRLVMTLAGAGLAVHAFGSKGDGAVAIAEYAASADSMAWSYRARREPPLPGCTHKSCANCPRYALAWRNRLLKRIATPQLDLFGSAA
ncbi:MAG TPA: hypothetical protein VF506_16690 [Streptosporangiaceae bacterium]